MKSGSNNRMINTHCYILWRGAMEYSGSHCTIEAITISMGEHGSLQTQSTNVQRDLPQKIRSGSLLEDLAAHNIAEIRRATEEAEKWEERINNSPLGKTQQDFVAYYTSVIALFKEWCISHGIPFPN